MGTALGAYDFILYAQAAALVFPEVFFPRFSPASGTLASVGTFAVAFAARPVGAILFGHYGDRLGRKVMLVTSLVLTGGCTLAVGLLPGYATIGLAAPVILVLLRLGQGVGLGGEWAGAVLMATEQAPAARRGWYAGFPQFGADLGPLLASGALFAMAALLSEAEFLAWGWRVPFLVGGLLVAVGVYARLKIGESPLFLDDVAGAADRPADADGRSGRRGQGVGAAARLPLWEVIRWRPRMLLLATGGLVSICLLGSMTYTVALTYGASLGVPSATMLSCQLTALAVNLPALPVIALMSDRVGRRPVCLAGAIAVVVWAYPLFALISTRSPLWITASLLGGAFIVSLVYVPMGAYLPELFETRARYSGVAVSETLATLVGAGLGTLVATALLAATQAFWPVTAFLAGTALVSLTCILALPETYRRDLHTPG